MSVSREWIDDPFTEACLQMFGPTAFADCPVVEMMDPIRFPDAADHIADCDCSDCEMHRLG